MSLRSVVVTAANSWRVPKGVTSGWVNAVAPGGAGQSHSTDGASGGSGAGAGEFCLGMPVPLTPDTFITLTPGSPGFGVTGGGDSTSGTPTSFLTFALLPGASVPSANGVNAAGAGGGPNGGVGEITPQQDGHPGSQESPTAFGGASGGTGEGLSIAGSGAGGQQIGEYATPRVSNIGSGHPGGGGGNSVFGNGGLGANSAFGGNNASGYGAGGSGMMGTSSTSFGGGNGTGGAVMIFYIAPAP